jgi:hypothetical protein
VSTADITGSDAGLRRAEDLRHCGPVGRDRQQHRETRRPTTCSSHWPGGLTIAVTTATATIDSDTAAFTGTRAGQTPTSGAPTVITLTDQGNGDGTARIAADGNRTADAAAEGGAASFGITVNALLPTADVSGAVRAYVGENTTSWPIGWTSPPMAT